MLDYAATYDIDDSNIVDGKPIFYEPHCGAQGYTINSNQYSAIYIFNCEGQIDPLIIANVSFEYTGQAIVIYNSSWVNITIENVNISNSKDGIFLVGEYPYTAAPLHLSNLRIGEDYEEGAYGLYLSQMNKSVLDITNNVIQSYEYGVYLENIEVGLSLNLSQNGLYNNTEYSIRLSNTNNVDIVDNTIRYDNLSDRPDYIEGRPVDYLWGTRDMSGDVKGEDNCSEDDQIYVAPYGVHISDSNYTSIENTNVHGTAVGYYLDSVYNLSLSDITVRYNTE